MSNMNPPQGLFILRRQRFALLVCLQQRAAHADTLIHQHVRDLTVYFHTRNYIQNFPNQVF